MKDVRLGFLFCIIFFLALLTWSLIVHSAPPPGPHDPVISAWFNSLMQPDNPTVSCCGVADGRRTKLRETKEGEYEAYIGEQWGISPGIWIPVPPRKILQRTDNPTGEAVVFWSSGNGIMCVVRPTDS